MTTSPLPVQPAPGVPVHAYWRGMAEVREDLRAARPLLVGLVLAGLPTGVLWWLLAPRADFQVTETGPVPVGPPAAEVRVADDAVFVLLLLGLGALAGAAAWRVRRGRGVGMLVALAVGTSAAAVLAWQLGELLAPPPTEAQLGEVGVEVTTGLVLSSLPGLAAAPFAALLVYLGYALLAADDGLDRS
ncbi:DUF2567 domain-containing protein [Blastococcus sp. KM273128]|uniref:hypothetical protein n=1 Tax=Blastococcus sp. KM273128 TaxID=2570314 RepID=UPI001F254C6B|nr:hypothetical protein [Blastococcus sp. KM273128]MCF6745432.1 DUF2567 domain-containing protein [Blastococcus sp. KM273128]